MQKDDGCWVWCQPSGMWSRCLCKPARRSSQVCQALVHRTWAASPSLAVGTLLAGWLTWQAMDHLHCYVIYTTSCNGILYHLVDALALVLAQGTIVWMDKASLP